MKIKKLADFLALLFVCVFVSYLVFSRGKMMVDAYNDEYSAYQEDLVEHNKCEADHDYLHKAPMKCIRARLAIQRWWRWHAIHRVYESTYLCIDQPCSDALRGVFDSWASLAVLTAFLLAVFLVIFGGISGRLNRGEKWHGRALAPQPQYYGNGSAVMTGYDYPPITIADGDGIRQRVAAWWPGQPRVRELI